MQRDETMSSRQRDRLQGPAAAPIRVRPETAKALGALLLYPTEDLRAALPTIRSLLSADNSLPAERRKGLAGLIEGMTDGELLDLEETYTGLFDRGQSLSLYLVEHVYGESRERGQAMVELIGRYERSGFSLAVREMPDHLSVICEFLSVAPAPAAAALLEEISGILALLARRLEQKESPYAEVLRALGDLAESDGAETASPATPEPADNTEQELMEIDRAWEEAPVTFGAQQPGPTRRNAR